MMTRGGHNLAHSDAEHLALAFSVPRHFPRPASRVCAAGTSAFTVVTVLRNDCDLGFWNYHTTHPIRSGRTRCRGILADG
jgi:hypothetical protein